MKTKLYVMAFLAVSIIPNLLFAQFTQQGPKMAAAQGSSVAISSDGNTAVVGGNYDGQGSILIYIRSAGVWSQQGTKLVGTGSGGDYVLQGYSVAISSDGNTVIEGGWADNNNIGAAWVFIRKDGIWTQQGAKLVGSDAVLSGQGTSVALSADGNTALVGGAGDNGKGAVWVFTRSGDIWTQHGSKLAGTGGIGQTNLGISLAISADGNTFVTGGYLDNGYLGAVWVFIRSGNDWVQQGEKLVGDESIDASEQGWSVAISSDGNTVISGGPGDWLDRGAVWVFTRSNGVWSQQGPVLYAEGSTSPIMVGRSVAITPDGNTALVGSPGSGGSIGKVWVFTRSAGIWTKQNSPFIGTGAEGIARQGWSVAISSEGTFIESGPFDDSGGAVWFFHDPALGIPEIPGSKPTTTHLEQNYPNPFNESTKVKFHIPKVELVKVTVVDITGREVSTLVNEDLNPGKYEVDIDGSKMVGGTYFYKLETDGFVKTKKMILVK